MPRTILAWSQAMIKVGETFDHNQHPPPGVPSGYVFPEPFMFANPDDNVVRQRFMRTYLKLHDAITYRITNLGAFKSLKSASDWRKLIGMELHGTKTDSKAAEKRRELVDELQKTMVANSEVISSLSHILAKFINISSESG
ncbi:hypothetical protein BT96DRAFT_835763 [Gymnopus androsaceus JB14]|uniref:Uncharacterized protein n=1 Tax=Gymnopus androsaceus JB14 TaxID=1447944 RepID=A0A6A4GSP2_9AGAR|nr:hypothetical protein BT96DRAFT_835763 [Gymnopus androsaceus JB14]